MANNIGNVNLSLGLDYNALESGMREVNNLLQDIKDNYKKAFAQQGKATVLDALNSDLAKTNQGSIKLKAQLDAVRNAWKSIDFTDGSAKNQAYIKEMSDKLLTNYIRIKEQIDKASISIDEYARKTAKISYSTQSNVNSALLGANEVKSMKDRSAAIQNLISVRDKLNKSDTNYEGNLGRLNKKIQQLTEANKKYAQTGVEVRTQTLKFADAAEWASRKLIFYTSIYTVQRFINKLAEVRGEFELQQKSLAAIIQNKYAADKIFGQIVDLALISPFKLRDLISYTKELSAYRIETEKLFDTTKMLADVSAGLGVDMSRLILAYGQVRSASVLRGQELKQFTEAGIPIVGELAKQFTILYGRMVGTDEVFELISKRMVSFEMVNQIFKDMTSSGGIFYNMQRIQAETLKGKISNLTDAIDIMYNKIGSANEGILKGGVDLTRSLITNFQEIVGLLKTLIELYIAYRAGSFLFVKGTALQSSGLKTFSAALRSAVTNMYGADVAFQLWRKNSFSAANLGRSFTSVLSAMGLALKTIGFGIKAVAASMLTLFPQALLMSVILFINHIVAVNKRIKEMRQESDKLTIATVKITDSVISQIRRLKELSTADGNNLVINRERFSIIGEIAKTEGDLAAALESNITNTEELNKLEEERIKLGRLQVFLNNELLESANGGEKTIAAELEELNRQQEKVDIATQKLGDKWIFVKQAIQDALDNGEIDSDAIPYFQKLLGITEMTKESIEEIYKFERLNDNDFWLAEDLLVLRERLGEYTNDLQDSQDKIEWLTKKTNKHTKEVMENIIFWLKAQYGDFAKLTDKQIADINNSIRDKFGEPISMRIMPLIDFRMFPITPEKVAQGWRGDIQKIVNGIVEDFGGYNIATELLTDQTKGLVDVLDDVASSYQKNVEVKKKYDAMSDDKRAKIKTDYNLLISTMSSEKAILDAYGYGITKTATTKDSFVEQQKNRLEFIEKVLDKYDEYVKKLSPQATLDKLNVDYADQFNAYKIDSTSLFKDNKTNVDYITKLYVDSLDILRKKRTKDNASTVDDLIRTISDELSKRDFEVRVKPNEQALTDLTDSIDRAFSDFDLTNEFGQFGDLASALLPNPKTLEQLLDDIQGTIAKYNEIGSDDALAAAKKLEEERDKLIFNRRKETIQKIADYQEKAQSNLDKITLTQAQISEDKQYIAKVSALDRSLTGDEKNLVLLADLRINANEKYLIELEDMAVKETMFYQSLFGDLDTYSGKMLQKIINDSKTALSTVKDIGGGNKQITIIGDNGQMKEITITTENYLSLIKQIQEAEEKLSNVTPFASAIAALREYIKGRAALRSNQLKIASLYEDLAIAESLGDTEAIMEIQEKIVAAKKEEGDTTNENTAKLKKGLIATSEGLDDIAKLVGSIGSLSEALGANQQTIDVISGIGEVIGGIGSIGTAIASGNPIEMVTGIIEGITSIAKGAITILDADNKAVIEKQTERLDALERAYSKLEEAKNAAFDLQDKAYDLSAMQNNIQEQIDAINKMRIAEHTKKNVDKQSLKDYNNQIADLYEQSKELKEEWLSELRGIDLTSAADDFATAWVDALLNGEDAMVSFEENFDDMIKQMIIKQASLRVISNILKPLFDQLDLAFGDDGVLTTGEITDIVGQIPTFMEQMNSAMEAIIKPMLEAAGLTSSSLSETSGLQADITSIQEDTAGKLVSLLNTMRYVLYRDSERLESIDLSLFAINGLTADSLNELRGIHNLAKEMRDWQKSITFAGHPRGGNGIKIFYGE